MDAKRILQADILDILFEGKNKEYGAYDLRKTYNKRLSIAIAAMILLLAILFSGYLLAGNFDSGNKHPFVPITEVDLAKAPDDKKVELPPPPKINSPKVETKIFTPPGMVNEEVREDEKPPEQITLETTKIGNINQEGKNDDDLMPPVSNEKGVVAMPTKDNSNDDNVFRKVEIEAGYPGGDSKWALYLGRNMRYPEDAASNGIQGTVLIQFIVDKEGNVTDVQAVGGPLEGGLREEAVRVIHKSGKWSPGIQNGRPVKSYKKQPIVFKLMAP